MCITFTYVIIIDPLSSAVTIHLTLAYTIFIFMHSSTSKSAIDPVNVYQLVCNSNTRAVHEITVICACSVCITYHLVYISAEHSIVLTLLSTSRTLLPLLFVRMRLLPRQAGNAYKDLRTNECGVNFLP